MSVTQTTSEEELTQLIATCCQRSEPSPEERHAARQALEELLRRNHDWILRMCFASCHNMNSAEDCAQEVLLRISKGIHSFQGNSKFSTWAFVIVKRTISDFKRKHGRQRSRFSFLGDVFPNEERSEIPVASSQANPEERLSLNQDRMHLLELIRTLPEKQQFALLMHYFEDLSVEETAERLSCSLSSVKTHLVRGRKRLQQLLESQTVERNVS